ncbi:MAG: hypothetical protein IPI67_26845 [Myxococcales bacterium]|nr:hypothetical protein [Myxococcales bacterium]
MTTGSLFPKAGPPRFTPLNEMRHEALAVETEEQLAANASAWGIVSVGGGVGLATQYASYRAYQLSYVVELDDSGPMLEPPPGAVYYPWRIYFGHSYEEVISGDARTFNADARASFLNWGGAISAFTQRSKLSSKMAGRGLVPVSGQAIFAKSPSEVYGNYRAEGPAVPIFTEFRQIPYRSELPGKMAWIYPIEVEIRFTRVQISEDGTWGSTPWNLRADCLLNATVVPVSDPTVLEAQRVDSPESVNLSWVTRISAFDGDRVECATSGSFSDHVTSSTQIARGAMQPVTVSSSLSASGEFRASNAKSSYAVSWTAQAIPKASAGAGVVQ